MFSELYVRLALISRSALPPKLFVARPVSPSALMEQQNSRDDGLGNTLSGGPAHVVRMKTDFKTSS